jgi:Ca2+-binding RTX toxin-like protein
MLGTNVDVPDKEPKTPKPKPKPDPTVWTGDNGSNVVDGYGTKDYLKYYGLGDKDVIYGGAKDNLIDGGDGDDYLDGGGGADTLIGGQGNDRLNGGFRDNAVDVLTGGSGADEFILYSSEGGADILTDFNPAEGDRIIVNIKGNPSIKSLNEPHIYSVNDFSYNQSSGALTFDNPIDSLAPSVFAYLPPNLGNNLIISRDISIFPWGS